MGNNEVGLLLVLARVGKPRGHKVEVVAALPRWTETQSERQRDREKKNERVREKRGRQSPFSSLEHRRGGE